MQEKNNSQIKTSGEANEPTPEVHPSAPEQKLRPRAEVILYSKEGIWGIKKDGYLMLPGGGIPEGERAKEAAIRETLEECDRICHNIEEAGKASAIYDPEVFKFKDWDGETTYFFLALDGGPAEMNHPDKEDFKLIGYDDARWFLNDLMNDNNQMWAFNNNMERFKAIKMARKLASIKQGLMPIKYASTMGAIKLAAENKKYPSSERAADAVALTGAGAAAGAGAGIAASRAIHGSPDYVIRLPHPNPKQTEQIRSSLVKNIKRFKWGARGALAGGVAGAAYGAYKASRKDGDPLPDAAQIPGILAGVGLAMLGLRNRGKVISALGRKSLSTDMYRGYNDAVDYLKKEPWISKKKFKDLDMDKVVINEELERQVRGNKRKPLIPIVVHHKPLYGKNVDKAWEKLYKKKSKYTKAIGGDPEAKVYMKAGGKRLSIDINPDFTGKNISGGKAGEVYTTPSGHKYQIVRDMSVGGYEITTGPEGRPEAFFAKINDIGKDVSKRMGKRYDMSSPAIGPVPGKSTMYQADRKMGGGHLHMQFPKDKTLERKTILGIKTPFKRSDERMREVLGRRAAFVFAPFDLTHKSMPYRSGLYGRSLDTINEPYGLNIVSKRTRKYKPGWSPEKGFINYEYRTSPTYIGGDVSLNSKKVKLLQLLSSNPSAAKAVDREMNKIVKQTGNETQRLYLPENRKRLVSAYRKIMSKSGIKDKQVDKVLDTYLRGEIMKTSEEKDRRPLYAASVAAPLAAAASYALFRRRPANLTDVQKASKKGITVVTEKGLSLKNRLINKLLISPDVRYEKIRGDGYAGNQAYRGVVYHKNWTNDVDRISRVSGDVTINPPTMHKGRLPLSEKEGLRKLPYIGKMFPKSMNLADLMERKGINPKRIAKARDKRVERILNTIERQYVGKGKGFIKPSYGQSMGKGTASIYAPVREASKRKMVKPHGIIESIRHGNKPYLVEHGHGLDDIKKNPAKYIIQENINPGGKNKEVRIHLLNGKVMDTVQRFGAFEGKPTQYFKSPKEKARFERKVTKLLNKIPAFRGASDARQSLIGMDAVRDARGKLRIVEINPNSGFLFPQNAFSTKPFDYYSTHTLYKQLTGRDSGFVAGAKALGVGAAAGGTAAAAARIGRGNARKER